jgi:hypothetical protein
MAEYYRQYAFVSSVLAGFAFSFYGVLLAASSRHRAASWAALMAVAASVAFLLVTLGMTFAASRAAALPNGAPLTLAVAAQQGPLSVYFDAGIVFLFASFGLGGWIRSRGLGIATTLVASIGLLGAICVLLPYIHVVHTP